MRFLFGLFVFFLTTVFFVVLVPPAIAVLLGLAAGCFAARG
jgi:hypothetical protein